jgi:hypothetical protein
LIECHAGRDVGLGAICGRAGDDSYRFPWMRGAEYGFLDIPNDGLEVGIGAFCCRAGNDSCRFPWMRDAKYGFLEVLDDGSGLPYVSGEGFGVPVGDSTTFRRLCD